MTYNDILKALFESTVLPPSKTLSGSSASDAFEPNERHPFDWSVHDPVASADPTLVASQLRRKINYGVLDPTSGETQARALGCSSLNPPPSPAAFDVASKCRWTLTMALAWVMWRSFDAARAVEADWIAAHQIWVEWKSDGHRSESATALFEEFGLTPPAPVFKRGWVLLPMAVPPYAVLEELAAQGLNGSIPKTTLAGALEQAWAALLNGELGGEGRLSGVEWTQIAPVEWNGLRLTTSDRLPTDRLIGNSRSYDEVRLSVPAVLKKWPEAAPAQPRHLESSDFKLEDKKAITASVAALLDVDRNSKKEDIEAHLRGAGWSFSGRLYNEGIWRVVVEEFPSLAHAGRRRKSPS